MSAPDAALIVIDVQESFRNRPYWREEGATDFVQRQQALIDGAKAAGIRTEQCCETTTRHASDLGYEVDFVAEATLTFPMTDASRREWSAAEIRARTELVLADRFARIATVEQALAGRAERIAA